MPPLLLLTDQYLTFGRTPLLEGAELSVGEGERLCLVGRNGSGKSTLLKIAAGLVQSDRGKRFLQPGTTLRYLPQEPDFTGFATVREFIEGGLEAGDDPNRVHALLGKLGFGGDELCAKLSGGEARRAALARTLAPSPDILLLDEPTNHLDLPAIQWLEDELKAMRSALVLISHDRRFLETLARACVWLDRGRSFRLDQGFAALEAWRDDLLEQEESERHKLDRKIAREEDWVRYGVTARRKRNVRRMAELGALRTQVREHRGVLGGVKMTVTDAQNAAARVVELRNVAKAYDGQDIVKDFSIRIDRGDRVGIVGRNGAGKTTLINMMVGRLAPDSGQVILGANLTIATLDQTRAGLDPDSSVSAVLTGGHGDTVEVGGQKRHVASYLKDFLFLPEQARTPVRVLSGGERARLLLAKTLATPANLLVLDEPTNDFDLETLDLLQETVANYPGTVLLVSHDRDFLDRVVTSIVMAEEGGKFVEYAGGYSDMVAQRGEGVAAKFVTRAPTGKKPVAPRKEAEPRRKLSFKDKHALETLPAEMAKTQAEIALLERDLAGDGLYARDPVRFAKVAARLAKAREDLQVFEERWLSLEMLREEIEGGA